MIRGPSEVKEAPVAHAPKEQHYDKLRKMRAEDFRGTTNLLEAEKWLQRTERIFEMMYYTPEEKLDYAISLLQEDAYDWWVMVPNSRVRPWILTYDDFLRAFQNKYMPAAYQNVKVREFINLKQGTMTVAEYEVKFDQLSRYAMHLIATKQDKCDKFEDRLRMEIKKGISVRDMHTFADLSEAALRTERLI